MLRLRPNPVGSHRVGLVNLAIKAVHEVVLVVHDPVFVFLAIEHRARVGVDLNLEIDWHAVHGRESPCMS